MPLESGVGNVEVPLVRGDKVEVRVPDGFVESEGVRAEADGARNWWYVESAALLSGSKPPKS